MRYDTPIYFQHLTAGAFNDQTGDYDADTVTEVVKYASVTDSSTLTINLVYGELKQGSKTIRLLNHYKQPFNRIRIGDKVYRVDMSRKLRTKQVFVVSEVQ